MPPHSDCRSVIMVGTHPTTMGGIATVVRGYMQAGLFERFKSVYVPTHRDGSRFQKAATALAAYLRIFVSLLMGNAPLLHVHVSSRASFWRKSLVCAMARLFRRPYLLHVHGSEFMTFYRGECGARAQRFVRSVFAQAALVLALSEQWRSDLLEICPGANVVVLPNAVLLPAAEALQNRGKSVREILFAGRLGQRKGVFDLLQAFARIVANFPDVRLICAGDGEIAAVKARSTQLGIGKRVDCLGWLDAAQTRLRFAAAGIFVLPSYAEGVPMAMLEAMSWGLPIICTPVGGIPEVVKSGENGLLVTPGDTEQLAAELTRLLEDGALRARLGAAARKTIEQSFALDVSVERLCEIYRRFGVS
jgi:glycosyltransferase involved in cell wall biosynthesis